MSRFKVFLQRDTLKPGPLDILAEGLPRVVVEVLLLDAVGQFGSIDISLDLLVQFRLLGSSGVLKWLAVVLIDSQHVVIAVAVHLDRENGRVVRKRLVAHFVNPRSEVKALDWRHGTLLLVVSDLIVVLTWRVEAEEHGLSRENRGVVPRGLDQDLGNVVLLVEELIVLLLHIAVSQLISNHKLLTNT